MSKGRYVPGPAPTYGCKICKILRELRTFSWRENVERFKALWAEGGCSAAMVGNSYLLLEHGEDESLFQIDPREAGAELAKLIGAIWIKNADMSPIEED